MIAARTQDRPSPEYANPFTANKMFHVKHALFAEAEAGEEGVDSIFNSRAASQAIKGNAR